MAHARPWAIIIIKIKERIYVARVWTPSLVEKKELFLADLAGLLPTL